MLRRVLLLAAVMMTFVIGCGRSGPPKPPELFSPAAVAQFSARGSVEGIELSWQAPQKQVNGDPLTDLSRFRIYRADFSDEGAPDYDPLAEIPYEGPPAAEVAEDDEEVQADDAFSGLRRSSEPKAEAVMVEYVDTSVNPGQRYLYYVVPYGERRTPGTPSATLLVTYVGEASQVELFFR